MLLAPLCPLFRGSTLYTVCKCSLHLVIIQQYGGDITRKMKLLRKQKEGKKKMKQIGNVELSKDAFLSVIQR